MVVSSITGVSQEQGDPTTKRVPRTEVRNLIRSLWQIIKMAAYTLRWVGCHGSSYVKGQKLDCSQGPGR